MLELTNGRMQPIQSLEDWTLPKHAYQWKDGRSAKELARAWCPEDTPPACPESVRSLLDSHPLTRSARLVYGRPEHVTPLPERGEGRNHDLWVRAELDGEPLTICVEGKADEPFGEPIGDYLERARAGNPKTGTARRARKLVRIVFGRDEDPEREPYSRLRYQLLTAAAGAVLQAAIDGARTAVLVVHEFRSHAVDPAKLEVNEADLTAFLTVMAGRAVEAQTGALLGPWRMLSAGDGGQGVDLLVGKIVTVLPA